MSEHGYPAILCDHEDGCEEFALDHTLGGLCRFDNSDEQLPPGWSGDRPGNNGEHYCPRHTQQRAQDGPR